MNIYNLDENFESHCGVDGTTAPELIKAGANVLVEENAIFSQKNITQAVRKLKNVQ
ncbi:MAG: hypothetical protein HY960_02650 [Ignavibacteriae bacterium]|nr:hypothetical protein [Ignavibacteriota bacterium]